MQGERRVVTVLFCDVVGSTGIAENLDPEDWTDLMNEAFDLLSKPVERYEGTISRLLGDALLAIFGAPQAHEDDPDRAVLAALEMIRAIEPFRKSLKEKRNIEFNVRVGINTGEAVTGGVGPQSAREYTAMGDAVNLAARMEQVSAPGTVRIAEQTYRLLRGYFEVERLSAVTVKGKREPVQTYRVSGLTKSAGGGRRSVGSKPGLVGRDAEVWKLRDSLAAIRGGRGKIVMLVGEAGLGKSRLLGEMQSLWRAEFGERPWLESSAMAYDSTRPYGMFRERLRDLFGLAGGESPQEAHQKIMDTFQSISPEIVRSITSFAEMALGLRDKSVEGELKPDMLQRAFSEGIVGAWKYKSDQNPIAFVFDDLQWADAASAELITQLFQLAQEGPVLFVIAFRPEQQSVAWSIMEYAKEKYLNSYERIDLGALSSDDTDALVKNLLSLSNLPEPIAKALHAKAEGNPLFIEEVVNSLLETGSIVNDSSGIRWKNESPAATAIPDTLQSMLLARIDRLPAEPRRTLQLASVVGRTFSKKVLEASMGNPVLMTSHLGILSDFGLIHETTSSPGVEFTFRHQLICDAAYNSILRRHRRDFHRSVGEAMESVFAAHQDVEAHRLAYHFSEAGDSNRAVKYHITAGDSAARLNANPEAIVQYSLALEAIKALAETPTAQILSQVFGKLGRSLELAGRFDDALNRYTELEQLGTDRNDLTMSLCGLLPQATIHSTYNVKYDPVRGRILSERALAMARQIHEPSSEAKAFWNLMLIEYYGHGDPRRAKELGESALAIARQSELNEELPFILNDLARVYNQLNDRNHADSLTREALDRWQTQGNLPMIVDSLVALGAAHIEAGRFVEGEIPLEEALRLSRSLGQPWGQAEALLTLSVIHRERGDFSKAITELKEAIPQAMKANFAGGYFLGNSSLAWIYDTLGDHHQASNIIGDALSKLSKGDKYRDLAIVVQQYVRHEDSTSSTPSVEIDFQDNDLGYIGHISLAHLFLGEMYIKAARYDKATEHVAYLSRAMQAAGMRIFLPDMLILKAKMLLAQGLTSNARIALSEAFNEAKAQGSRRGLVSAICLMALTESEEAGTMETKANYAAGREAIAYLSDHAGTPELQSVFLAQEAIRSFYRL